MGVHADEKVAQGAFRMEDLVAGVRNSSIKKTARYQGEKPSRPDLPRREELEATSHRFAVKYLLAVMNSSSVRDLLLLRLLSGEIAI